MSNTTTKVLAGCGVGCLFFLVAIGGLGWMGYRWAKTAVEVVEEAERAEERLEAEYGAVQEFTPPVDGRIAADRIEAFLAVRELMAPQRTALSESITALEPTSDGGAVSGLRAARAGLKMAPRILEFARARNAALLEVGMGPGEYTWIYWLTYHGWLGHPVGESMLNEIMESSSKSGGSVQMHIDGIKTEEAEWRLRRDLYAMLQNLERELSSENERFELSEVLADELAALDGDPGRMPWPEALPEIFAAGLEPYRDRLEVSYSPATNIFELLELDSGPHGVTLE